MCVSMISLSHSVATQNLMFFLSAKLYLDATSDGGQETAKGFDFVFIIIIFLHLYTQHTTNALLYRATIHTSYEAMHIVYVSGM